MRLPSVFAALAGLAALFAVTLAMSLSGTVDQQERGVYLRNGAIVSVEDPGRYFKLPIIDKVRTLPVSQQVVRWSAERSLEAYSKDQQPATVALSIIYHIPADHDSIRQVYAQYGTVENLEGRLINRVAVQQFKTIFGRFTAASAIQQRDVLNAEVAASVRDSITGPVVIDGVQIEDVSFSDAYENSIERRMLAEVEVQKAQQDAAKEKVTAEITVIQAQARADAQVAEATAKAEAIRLEGDATAAAIQARGDALRENPSLVSLTAAERWDGKLPSTMVPGASVPFVGLK